MPVQEVPAAPPPEIAAPTLSTPVDIHESGSKNVKVGFFFPSACEAELAKVKEHFKEVIKKHKLKFNLEGVFAKSYGPSGALNYSFFVEQCKIEKVAIAIVLGPGQGLGSDPDEFGNLLGAVMDDAGISLQLVPWSEMNKDYRYLNLALDITLLRQNM